MKSMDTSFAILSGKANDPWQIQCVESATCVEEPQSWYVLYVKSRQEFIASAELTKKGITVFLPSIKKLSQWKDRKKVIESPLFPGYLFVQIPSAPGAYLDVLKTRGVVTFISLEPGIPTPVDSAEMTSLQLLVESGREIDIQPGLQEGTVVRLKSGPLVDASGVLVRKENELVFIVNIELLGRNVAVRVSPQDIEAV